MQTFAITFEYDNSGTDLIQYSECAYDFIYWNSDYISFDLPISDTPIDVTYTPLIQQEVSMCPI